MQSARVALVTGASRGVGRGIANALAATGFKVYATGRTIATANLHASVTRITCDHTRDEDVQAAFDVVRRDQPRLDILVNNAWGGYERMVDTGRFTWALPFWEQPLFRWTSMIDAGVRAAFVASQHAAKLMVPDRSGLIVNISTWAAQKFIGNSLYGISKAATDKLTGDTAHELRAHGVSVISLYPGLVRTEAVVAAGVFDLSNSESPEFAGLVIAALATDPNLLGLSGKVVVAAQAAREYGVNDIDGRQPRPLTIAEV